MEGLVLVDLVVEVVVGQQMEVTGLAAEEVAPPLVFLETGLAPLPIPALEVVPEFQTLSTKQQAQAAMAAPDLLVSGGLNKENRNELCTHQKQRG
jgi:hypothetical protein